MAGRPPNRSSQPQAVPAPSARQNEYFVPRDGIDREVITSDICRYLGNDALVRPGTYESSDGRVTQGYFITAYRNLTSAMIQDLKADSARWEQERRAASRSSGGGAGARESRGPPNDYNAWKRQQEQEYNTAYHQSSAMDIDYPAAPGPAGNPPYGGQPYMGGQPAYPPASYPPPVHPASAPYPAQPYGYPPNPPAQYSPSPQTSGDRYPPMPPPPAVPGSYAQDAFVHGSNYQTSPGYATAGPARMPPPMPHATAAPSRTFSAPTAGAPVYGTEPDTYYPPPAGTTGAPGYPTDALYGRGAYATTNNPTQASSDDLGSPAGATPRQGYAAVPEPAYDDAQNPVLQPATTPTNAVPAPSGGAPAARRDRDSEPRERERDRDRDHREHRTRRSEPERDDRHPDRNRHRHR
ncbi:hypothetical protein MFIFM68171_02486 [Madurella fahalii]|uniref:Transcription factor RfeG n=1 Tax=Madurella fahalii TaxID=1157608 RepID=A0ABQ0G3D2_9PEZI